MKLKNCLNKEYLLLSVLLVLTVFSITSCGNKTDNERIINTSSESNKEFEIESNSKKDKLIIAIGEWAPYTGKDLPDYGICTEIAAEVLNSMGVEYEFKFCPWERALKETEDGIVWGTLPWFYVPERNGSYLYSTEVLWNSRVMIFYHKPNPNIHGKDIVFDSLEDLKAYHFGGVKGYFYEGLYEREGYQYELTVSIDSAFQMLASDRVDFILEDEIVGTDSIKRLFPDNANDFGTLNKPYNEGKMFLMVSKKYPNAEQYLKKFDKALKTFKESDQYKEIMDKYGTIQ